MNSISNYLLPLSLGRAEQEVRLSAGVRPTEKLEYVGHISCLKLSKISSHVPAS